MARIYVLSAGRRGDLGQMTDVAVATGLPLEVRHLQFHGGATWRKCLWPAHFLTIPSPEVFAGIEPHDVVLCAEAHVCALVAKKRRSGNKFIAVCIGRPRGYFDDFDLIITSPQYELPPGQNVFQIPYPPHQLPEYVSAALKNRPPASAHPRHVCLIGGSSAPDMLDREALNRIIDELQVLTSRDGYEVDILFSPRTSLHAKQHIVKRADMNAMRVHDYADKDGEKYWCLLSQADSVSVTADSVSMIVESMLTGRPVHVHKLSQQPRLYHKITRWMNGKGVARKLFERGILEPRPNRQALLDSLTSAGLIETHRIDGSDGFPAATTRQAASEILKKIAVAGTHRTQR
jgi:uncharacterized protein